MPFEFTPQLIAILGIAGVSGWVLTTWIRVKNGYPLDGAWGQSVYPKSDAEAQERVGRLTHENAQLHTEMGSIKDRLAVVERIVTDGGYGLTQEIEKLTKDRADGVPLRQRETEGNF